MEQSEQNGKALHSLVRIFNHDLYKVIEKLNLPESDDSFNIKDPEAKRVFELGERLSKNSDWNGIKNGMDEEFIKDLKEMKDLFLEMAARLWDMKVSPGGNSQ